MEREEIRCRHIGYSFRLAARVLLYASSHIQDNTYRSFCYTSRGALAGTRNSLMGQTLESLKCLLLISILKIKVLLVTLVNKNH